MVKGGWGDCVVWLVERVRAKAAVMVVVPVSFGRFVAAMVFDGCNGGGSVIGTKGGLKIGGFRFGLYIGTGRGKTFRIGGERDSGVCRLGGRLPWRREEATVLVELSWWLVFWDLVGTFIMVEIDTSR
ncbi:unnamed protein product [Dovyalis caffra]|uniref:Uncharacterized protein n=1 Tax=Dovyalis caffra TaxID=77055 RepID=A0AAV1RVQ1_9ROSI|nr:unnamed protein product [Dovyalis caffra]